LKIIFHIIGLHQKFCPPPLEAKKAQRNQNKIPRTSDIAILLTITLEKTHFFAFAIIENLKNKLSQYKLFLKKIKYFYTSPKTFSPCHFAFTFLHSLRIFQSLSSKKVLRIVPIYVFP